MAKSVLTLFEDDTLIKASTGYSKEMECYEVELIKNDLGDHHDTEYRIELADNEYMDITLRELFMLKELLNNKQVLEFLTERGDK